MLSPHASLLLLRDGWNAITTGLLNLIARIRDPYRPELHYMRGPGPKWHAKHAVRAAAAG
ncbi:MULTISPECIES: hypothetical protein [Bradyrhizobium]|jgi:hypothetical protein|uniref:hypothetical protein n=1 Tax=Bradyrhizobium TaxID=374 RepID=UPI000483CC66|nr:MULTISPECIES: hypothetical protein [Bradyrhizobium]MCS3452710.1 hypothetical protein [Bradyrhizobium elkanii]MCS3565186.1 hypothetical protein [Bradyrhizobium elkanii]MCW2144986.1 hypothetical protein [Bradyrhizobium elkanii]MCW2356197.1 hypothetical protein [Bradyrhizobium elkanii]MCW2377812.1 hypothetical protein [Bradyrhizobium elkanii]